ncbi:unnamed protein product [Phytomonas sp. EM1]|nr:unnamed protein product [Phytomonas sp. EM1]|eukprot:CCW61944.1 unnamed protein product [Phytomonas sp. isolate EM1]
MWRQILARAGVYVNPTIRRQHIVGKNCQGLVCSEGIAEGEVIAAVPFWYCTAPIISLASPWGQQLGAHLSDVSHRVDGIQVEFSRESLLTIALTALSMEPPSILADYLNFISNEHATESSLGEKLGDDLMQKLRNIQKVNDDIIRDTQIALRSCGLNIELGRLRRAHALCESRCVDIPFSEEVFGGPALVPFLDLINHGETQNITVLLTFSDDAVRRAKRSSCAEMISTKTPFYVMVLSAGPLSPDEELTYPYVDPDEEALLYKNPLYWALRFHFFPSSMENKSEVLDRDKAKMCQ